MMGTRTCTAAVSLAALTALGGCADTHVLVHTSSTTRSASSASPRPAGTSSETAASAYVAQLRHEEQTLAAAERRIPTRVSTPQELSRSASLLAAAVSRLDQGLSVITPPPSVAPAHAELVAIVRAYAARLNRAARIAVAPAGQVRAATLMVSATNRASTEFSAVLSKIYSTLGVRQP